MAERSSVSGRTPECSGRVAEHLGTSGRTESEWPNALRNVCLPLRDLCLLDPLLEYEIIRSGSSRTNVDGVVAWHSEEGEPDLWF